MSLVHKILSVVTAGLLAFGIYDYVTNFEENGCSMTYMFRLPQYLPVPGLQERVNGTFPRYSLYHYVEGKTKKFSPFEVSGIPVLFIPGNGGCYKQVRSLASVALMKTQNSGFHFDYFSVDLDKEKNALYGGFLWDQTEFIHQCIHHILSLYSDIKNPPKSVVLVGHSMGGVLARALFALSGFDNQLVHTIITQSTPHSPVLRVDQLLDNFYWNVNRYWQNNQESLNHVTFLSVGGGHRDVLVKSAVTGLNGIVAPSRHVSTVSMTVPHVWLSTDHKCMVWCKELVLVTKRALIDMVDPKTNFITEDAEKRMEVFRFHFGSHSGGKYYQKHQENTIKFAEKKDISFKLVADSRLHIATSNKDKTSYYLFPVPSSNHGFIATTKITSARWVFLCTHATKKTCQEGIDVTMRGRVAPPLKSGVREIRLSPKELKDHQFVVVRVPSGTGGVINAEMFEEKHTAVDLPAFFSLESNLVMNITGRSYVSLALEGFTSVSTAYVAELVYIKCASSVKSNINSTLRFEVPWKNEDTFSVTPARSTNALSLKLQSGRPPSAGNESMPRLSAYVDPRCKYQITLSYSHKEGYGQIVRFYGHTIPTFLVIIIVLATSFQLKHLYADKPLEKMSKLHDLYCKPYIVVPPIALFRAIVKNEALEQSYDFRILSEQGIFFNFLPLVMFLLSYGLCAIFLVSMEIKSSTSGRIWKWWNKGNLPLEMFNPRRAEESSRLWPFAVTGALIAVALGTCGVNAIILLIVLVGFKAAGLKAKVLVAESKLPGGKVTVQTKDKEKTHRPSREELIHRQASDSFNWVSTFLVLLNFLMIFTTPVLVTWYENLKYEFRLGNDPSLYPALLASVSVIDLLGNAAPLPKKSKLVKPVSWLLYFFAVLMVLYAIDSVYRCTYFLSAALLLLSILQLV